MKLRFKCGVSVRYGDRLLKEGDVIEADESLIELHWFEAAEKAKPKKSKSKAEPEAEPAATADTEEN